MLNDVDIGYYSPPPPLSHTPTHTHTHTHTLSPSLSHTHIRTHTLSLSPPPPPPPSLQLLGPISHDTSTDTIIEGLYFHHITLFLFSHSQFLFPLSCHFIHAS